MRTLEIELKWVVSLILWNYFFFASSISTTLSLTWSLFDSYSVRSLVSLTSQLIPGLALLDSLIPVPQPTIPHLCLRFLNPWQSSLSSVLLESTILCTIQNINLTEVPRILFPKYNKFIPGSSMWIETIY